MGQSHPVRYPFAKERQPGAITRFLRAGRGYFKKHCRRAAKSINETHSVAAMKKVLLFFVPFSYFIHSSTAFSQGSLTPLGPPAPNMKTPDQVEPRRLIEALPFTINQAGSYYLTKNLHNKCVTLGGYCRHNRDHFICPELHLE